MLDKSSVIDEVWQHSKYHGNLLAYCDSLSKVSHANGFATLLFLLNIIENTMKDAIKDYDSGFHDVLKKVKHQGLINYKEAKFLNAPNNSVRKLRNILAHSNLSKYSVIYLEDEKEISYPLTEEETCLKIYETISDVCFNIILKVLNVNFPKKYEIDLGKAIDEAQINIKEYTPEELLAFKGLEHLKSNPPWLSLSDTDKYRLIENSSDVNVLASIFDGLIKQGYLK